MRYIPPRKNKAIRAKVKIIIYVALSLLLCIQWLQITYVYGDNWSALLSSQSVGTRVFASRLGGKELQQVQWWNVLENMSWSSWPFKDWTPWSGLYQGLAIFFFDSVLFRCSLHEFYSTVIWRNCYDSELALWEEKRSTTKRGLFWLCASRFNDSIFRYYWSQILIETGY